MKSLFINVFWGPHREPTWSARFTEDKNGEHHAQLSLGAPLSDLAADDGPWEALSELYRALALIRKGDSPR